MIDHFGVEAIVPLRLRHAGRRAGSGVEADAVGSEATSMLNKEGRAGVPSTTASSLNGSPAIHRQRGGEQRRRRYRSDVLQSQRIDHQSCTL